MPADLSAVPNWHDAEPIDRPLTWYFAKHAKIYNTLAQLGCEYMRDVIGLPDDYLLGHGLSADMRLTFRKIVHQEAGLARPDYAYIRQLDLPGDLDQRLRRKGIMSIVYLDSLTQEKLRKRGFTTSDYKAIRKAIKTYKQD